MPKFLAPSVRESQSILERPSKIFSEIRSPSSFQLSISEMYFSLVSLICSQRSAPLYPMPEAEPPPPPPLSEVVRLLSSSIPLNCPLSFFAAPAASSVASAKSSISSVSAAPPKSIFSQPNREPMAFKPFCVRSSIVYIKFLNANNAGLNALINPSPKSLPNSCNNCLTVRIAFAQVSAVFWKSPIAILAFDITY